jgi:hypothetical protein
MASKKCKRVSGFLGTFSRSDSASFHHVSFWDVQLASADRAKVFMAFLGIIVCCFIILDYTCIISSFSCSYFLVARVVMSGVTRESSEKRWLLSGRLGYEHHNLFVVLFHNVDTEI